MGIFDRLLGKKDRMGDFASKSGASFTKDSEVALKDAGEKEMNCDFCNRPISPQEITRVSRYTLRDAVNKGFNIYEAPGINASLVRAMSIATGVEMASVIDSWKRLVMRDNTDWGLCPDCKDAFDRWCSKQPEKENIRQRMEEINKIERIGNEKAVKTLINFLNDDYTDIQEKVISSLVKIGEPAVEPLIQALEDENRDIRWSAAEALEKIGEPAIKPLINSLNDDETDIRETSAEILGRIGDNRAVDPLIHALGDENSGVRRKVAEALGSIGDKEAIEPLIHASKDEKIDVRREAMIALDNMGWRPPSVFEQVDYLITTKKWNEIINIGEPAVESLIQILEDKSSDVNYRVGAVAALGRIGDVRAVEPLIQALEDEDSYVRYKAVEVLGNLRDKRLVETFIQALKDENIPVRKKAAEALIRIGEPAIEPLAKGFKR
ncbi:MAG: HEAT repeat domain-containing protein [Methanophagales archaeon]|nr:HEAT repeat domain-containing protein [Methanophagales archaeon]